MLISSLAGSLLNFRGDFICSLVTNDFEVFCAAPDFDKETIHQLSLLKAHSILVPLSRTGLNPFADLKSILVIKKIIEKYAIDVVFPYTIKPVVYGSIAAHLSKKPAISLITGLGYTFSGVSTRAKLLQNITRLLYQLALRNNKAVVFQNEDDYLLFVKKRIVSKQQPFYIVNGSGVNLNRFKYRTYKKHCGPVSFIIIARLIEEKGTGLYLEAAKTLIKKFPETIFHIVGSPPKNNSSGTLIDNLNRLTQEGIIVYHGAQPNVVDFLSNSDVFVLPTYYREGIPRSILEALSVGMPVITTLTPGCKETVENMENGILIPPKDLEALINAMEFFVKNPESIQKMGQKSREIAEQKFDVNKINQQLITIINSHI